MLKNKVVLITGAASGIGKATAIACAQAGAHLALIDKDGDALSRLFQELHRSASCTISTARADMSVEQEGEQAIEAVMSSFERVDILVSNVGQLFTGKFLEISAEQWRASHEQNFLAHVLTCQAVYPYFQKEGCVIFTGSDQANQPDAHLSPYVAAKTALHGLAKALAREFAPGIRVNVVAPGMTRTSLVEQLMGEYATQFGTDRSTAERIELERRGVPLRRLLEPEEVAEAILFLASCTGCTGTILNISAGNVRGISA